jgi:peptidoglycan/LPS O-acetylase OafA/YrhL
MIKSSYFDGLDGLRFFAAFAVIVHHAELIKVDYAVSNAHLYRYFLELGPIAVTFFFVLSGFLITSILFSEKSQTNTIDLLFFYLKRLLRIFPLYIIITFLSFIILPYFDFFSQPFFSAKLNNDYTFKLMLYALMQPHMVYVLYPGEPIPYGVVAWSIGVEEHFYLVWPLIIKYLRNYFYLFITIIIIFSVIPFLAHFSINTSSSILLGKTSKFFETLRFSCMAIGGLGALYYLKRVRFKDILYSRFIEYGGYLLLVLVFVLGYPFLYFKHEFYSVLFIILILNISSNSNSILSSTIRNLLESKSLKFLGVRSYGIYMYHMIAIQIAIKLTLNFYGDGKISLFGNLFFYFTVFISTLFMAILSFEYIEKPILNFKSHIKFNT